MVVLVLLSAAGPAAVTLVLLVLAELSRRLGAVLKTRKTHRWFYLAAIFTASSVLVRLLSLELAGYAFNTTTGHTTYALAYTLPLTTGVCIGLAVAWHYWGWLVYASDGKTLVPRRHR